MDSITEEKIARLLVQLKEMKVGAQNAEAVGDKARFAQANMLVSMVENELRKLKPDIVFPEVKKSPLW
jgi:hypothetical protein